MSCYGFVYLALSVPVEVDPEGGDPVQVAPPFRVDKIGPLPLDDYEGLLGTPVPHLGEGVPEAPAVELRQLSE